MTTADRSELRWRKSSRSSNYGNCVEVAFAGDDVLARDSKNPAAPYLAFDQLAWASFVQSVRNGRFS